MSESEFLKWLGMMLPVIFSAGPANIAMASFGGRFGLRTLLPFLFGINVTVLLVSIAVGFGMGQIIETHGLIFKYLQVLGAIYLCYLAFRLIRESGANGNSSELSVPGFFDGVLLQMLNMKVFTVTIIMFSHFLEDAPQQTLRSLSLSIGIATLTTAATFAWTLCGSWLASHFNSDKFLQIQGKFFGTMLALTAFWMLF